MEAIQRPNNTTLGTTLAERIRDDIVCGVYLPNARLRLSDLSQRYQASPIPVREALTRLASAGFILSEPQRGFRVTSISLEELQDITECRIFTEREALRRSIKNGDVEWEANLVSAHHHLQRLRMVSDGQPGMDRMWDAAHTRFHQALLAACDSKWLLHMTEMMREQTARYRHLSICASKDETTSASRNVPAEHQALLQAALDRDEEKALDLLAEHFQATTDLVISLIDTPQSNDA